MNHYVLSNFFGDLIPFLDHLVINLYLLFQLFLTLLTDVTV